MVIYIDIDKNGKVGILKYEYTEESNKLKIPKTRFTDMGIFDSVVKTHNDVFYSGLYYMSFTDDARYTKLKTLLTSLVETDICYVVGLYAKELVKARELYNTPPKFEVFSGEGCDIILTLMTTVMNLEADEFTEIDFHAYFKSKMDIHPLMRASQLFQYKDMTRGTYYSYSNKESIDPESGDTPGLSKSRIILGKKTTTNSYSVFKIAPIDVVDKLYADFREKVKLDLYTITILDRIKRPNSIYHIENDNLIFRDKPRRLETASTDVVISEVYPAGISYYAFEVFNEMNGLLNQVIDKSDKVVNNSLVDITNLIYDDEYKIRFVNDFTIEHIYLNDRKVFISSGLDMPCRNALKAVEKFKPRVEILIINADNTHARYQTVVSLSNGEAVMTSNYPANLVIL